MPTDPPEPPDSTEQPKRPEIPRSLFGRFAKAIRDDWRSRARPAQIPPEDFSVLLLLAGRGAGKNWTASNYVNEQAASGAVKRIALVGATASDTRFVMVEGESGVLAAARAAGVGVNYEPGKGSLTWPSGAIARCFSADTPDQLRGPEHDLAWTDEIAAWRRADETWSNLLLTLRIGTQPRIIATTTPRPVRLIRDLVARDGTDGIVVRRMSTYDNRQNLAPQFFAQLVHRFEGTRLARQELLAEVLEDVPGALWSRDTLEATRVDRAPEHLQRIVIGVDPAGSSTEGADLTGILVCGIGLDGEGYVLADLSRRGTPREWASAAIAAYRSLKADKIVIERNFGGEMAAATLASVDPTVPVKEVTSSRGKVLRAEPIGSIFEQRRAHIVGTLPELEDQLCSFTSDWNRARDGSPDRVDAMVFAFSELMLEAPPGRYIQESQLMLPPQENEARAPVGIPIFFNAAYASVSAAVTPDGPVAGVIYFAACGLGGEHEGQRLIYILDWDIVEVNPAMLSTWPSAVFRRSVEFALGRATAGHDCMLFLDSDGLGQIVLDALPPERLGRVQYMETAHWGDYTERAITAAGFVTSGRVRITPPAHEKIVAFKGVSKNHLLGQVTAFGLSEEKTPTGPLLVAFANGVIPIFTEPKSPQSIATARRR